MDIKMQLNKGLAQLLFWLLDFLDGIMDIFQILAGIKKIPEGESLIDIFLNKPIVTQAFFSIFLLSIFVVGINCIIAIIKGIIVKGSSGERKSPVRTVAQGGGAIVTSLIMAFVMILGIGASNTFLSLTNQAISASPQKNLTISQTIFEMSIIDDQTDYKQENVEIPLYNMDGTLKYKMEDGEYVLDEKNEKIIETESKTVWVVNSGQSQEINWNKLKDNKDRSVFGQAKGTDKVFGERWKLVPGETGRKLGIGNGMSMLTESELLPYKTPPIVEYDNFNFWIAYFVTIVMLVCIVFTTLMLGKRFFDIIFLFIILPFLSATIPLDDGARFRKWRETVVSKVALAYGAVISMAIFIIFCPVIVSTQLSLGSRFKTSLLKAFLLLAGALSINNGTMLFARLLGTDASEAREASHAMRTLISSVFMSRGIAARAVGGKSSLSNIFGSMNSASNMLAGDGGGGGLQAYRGGGGSLQSSVRNSSTGQNNASGGSIFGKTSQLSGGSVKYSNTTNAGSIGGNSTNVTTGFTGASGVVGTGGTPSVLGAVGVVAGVATQKVCDVARNTIKTTDSLSNNVNKGTDGGYRG